MADVEQSIYSLEPGSTFSHFRLERMLGEGGMGAVYLAEDLTLTRRVALKFMSRSLVAQMANTMVRENIEQRFVREARSAAALNHPNLCQIYEANFETENWYIAMEYIDGKSLSQLTDAGVEFTLNEVIDVARQTMHGLQYAWDNAKIVHRDIKPQNIMLTRDSRVKIVDLGLAKPMNTDEPDPNAPELTSAGTPVGTPRYMAPEQATGDAEVDTRADIFALGATLYEILTGQKAFAGNTAPIIYMAQLRKDYKPIKSLRADVPDAMVTLIEEMLEPNKVDRLDDYAAALQRLDEIEKGGPAPARPSRPVAASQSIYTPAEQDPASASMTADFYPVEHLILGRYQVLKQIGRSRAGYVYECRDTQANRSVAVKSLMPNREFPAAAMPVIAENFRRLMAMSHPNLVKILDVQVDDQSGELVVVMEMLDGRNLRGFTYATITAKGELTVSDIAPVLQRVAKALDSVNQSFGTIHYDLKPESVYLRNNDRDVVLIDYGICNPVGPNGRKVKEFEQEPLSNPDYMAPELFRGESPASTADQYSLAVIAYEMLARKLPLWAGPGDVDSRTTAMVGADYLARMRDLALNKYPAPLADLSPAANEAFRKAFSKEPPDRHPTCEAFVRSLGGTGFSLGAHARTVLTVAAVLLVVVGIGLGVYFTLNGQGRNSRLSDRDTLLDPRNRAEVLRADVQRMADDLPESAKTEELMPGLRKIVKEADSAFSLGKYEDAEKIYEQARTEVIAMAKQIEDFERQRELERRAESPEAKGAELRGKIIERLATAPDTEFANAKLNPVRNTLERADLAYERGGYEEALTLFRSADAELSKAMDQIDRNEAEEREKRQRLEMKTNAEIIRDKVRKQLNELPSDLHSHEMVNPTRKAMEAGEIALQKADYPEAIRQFENADRALTAASRGLAKLKAALEEAQLREQRQQEEAERLKRSYQEQFQVLAAKDGAKDLLPKVIAAADLADQLFEGGDLPGAIRAYKNAVDAVIDAENTLLERLKTQAEALKEEAENLRDATIQYDDLDPSLGEKAAKYNLAMGLAREAMDNERFELAVEQYRRARDLCREIQEAAEKKFSARPGKDFTVARVGMEMVWIESLKLWAGRYEVTNGQYRRFKPQHSSKKTREGFTLDKDAQPVCHVKYFDAVSYADWLNATVGREGGLPEGFIYRLPTKAEWQALARCGEERLYPWGNSWPPPKGRNFGNQEVFPGDWKLDGHTDDFPATCEVSKSGKNDWGLYGISGNVWEWTNEQIEGKYAVFGGGWADVDKRSLVIDPAGFNYADPNEAYDNIGFRVLLAPKKK